MRRLRTTAISALALLVPLALPACNDRFVVGHASPGTPDPTDVVMPAFALPETFDVVTSARLSAVADLNGDGRPDLVFSDATGNGPPTGVVIVMMNDGGGTFPDSSIYATGSAPGSIAIGDVTADGWPDVITVDGDAIGVLRNLGDGTFLPLSTVPVGSAPLRGGNDSIAVGDLDGDGLADIVTGTFDQQAAVNVFRNRGGGTFGAREMYLRGAWPATVALADFDGDGKLDVAVDLESPHYVDGVLRVPAGASVLLNHGNGTFGDPISCPAAVRPFAMATGDVDGDARPDVVTLGTSLGAVDASSGALTICLNTGQGACSSRLMIPAEKLRSPAAFGGDATRLSLVDISGDGWLDVVGDVDAGARVWINDGEGDGGLRAPLDYWSGSGRGTSFSGDLDGDGWVDVVSQSGATVSILRNDGAGELRAPRVVGASGAQGVSAVGDLDGNGLADLVVGVAGAINVFLARADGTFAAPVSYEVAGIPTAVLVADFNGDRMVDLAVTGEHQQSLSILWNWGAGTFAPARAVVFDGVVGRAVVGDFNANGSADLAVTTEVPEGTSAGARVLLGGEGVQVPVSGSAFLVAVGDVDGDRRDDLATADNTTVTVATNLGLRTAATRTVDAIALPLTIELLDADGDGRDDLVVAESAQSLKIYMSDGGRFSPARVLSTCPSVVAMTKGDFNGDRAVDLSIRCADGSSQFLINERKRGGGWVAAPVPALPDAASVSFGDLNGDGKPELIVTDMLRPFVRVVLNTSR